MAAIGVGFLTGAAISPLVGVRLGLGPVLLGASVVGAVGIGVVALAQSGVVLPAVGAALFGAGGGLFNLQSIAIRQAVTPAPLLGRVTGVVKVASYSAIALGAFLGGSLLATACLVRPAVRRLRALPD